MNIQHPTAKQVAYIRRNINKLPFHVMRNQLRVSVGVMYEWVKNVYQPDRQVIVDEDGQELHNAYLVTLNGFNYIVTLALRLNTIPSSIAVIALVSITR